MRFDGIPFSPVTVRRAEDKPRLVVLTDVSLSVRATARFTLHLVHGLQNLFGQVRTFAFVAELVEITDLFEDHPVEHALGLVFGGDVLDVDANSDYGAAFGAFHEDFSSAVTRRTTVLVLGDGRGNGNDPNLPAFEEITRRARGDDLAHPGAALLVGPGRLRPAGVRGVLQPGAGGARPDRPGERGDGPGDGARRPVIDPLDGRRDRPPPDRRRTVGIDADGRVRHDIAPTSSATTSPAGSPTTWSPPASSTPPPSRRRSSRSCSDVDPGWTAFYRNTLRALAARRGARRDQRRHGAGARPRRRARRRPARRGAGLLLRVPVAAARRRGPPGDGRRPRARARRACSAASSPALGTPVTTLAGDARPFPLATVAPTPSSPCTCSNTCPAASTPPCSPRCCGSPAAGPSSPSRSRTSPTPRGGTSGPSTSTTCTPSARRPACPSPSTEHHGGWLVIDQDA